MIQKSHRNVRGERTRIYGLFGDDPYAPAERGFSIVRPKMVNTQFFCRTEWSKRIATIYMAELRTGRADGDRIKGFVSPYPAEPPSQRRLPGRAQFDAHSAKKK